jgi:hypothetical protein
MLEVDFIAAYKSLGETDQDQGRLESFAKKLIADEKIWRALTNAYHSPRLDPILGNLDRHKKFVQVLHVGLAYNVLSIHTNTSQ